MRATSISTSHAIRRGLNFGPISKAGNDTKQPHVSPAVQENQPGELKPTKSLSGSPIAQVQPANSDTKINLDKKLQSISPPTVKITEIPDGKTTSKTFVLKSKGQRPRTASPARFIPPIAADVEKIDEIRNAQNLGISSENNAGESYSSQTIRRGDFISVSKFLRISYVFGSI